METIEIRWKDMAEHYYDLRRLEYIPSLPQSSIPAVGHLAPTTVKECIQYEFESHVTAIDASNLWGCPKCNQKVDGIKCKRFWKTPDVLMIAFKRFRQSGDYSEMIKVDRFIQFPLSGLNLTSYLSNGAPVATPVYDLYGVCRHHGVGLESGHCTSCVKSPEGQWHQFDDDRVMEIDEHSIVNKDAYLLFYRRRHAACMSEDDILAALQKLPEIEALAHYRSRLSGQTVTVGDIYSEEFRALQSRHLEPPVPQDEVVPVPQDEVVPDRLDGQQNPNAVPHSPASQPAGKRKGELGQVKIVCNLVMTNRGNGVHWADTQDDKAIQRSKMEEAQLRCIQKIEKGW